MQAKILTVANQKGGVGKTTTVMNLGVSLAKQGLRVLLIDSDPQANLTSYLGVVPGAEPFENLRTLDEVLLAKRALTEDDWTRFIAHTSAGVDLLAADANLNGVEHYLFMRSDRELVLAGAISNLRGRYDWILIDTPPSLNLLTLNALCASDRVLIPVQPEFFSLEGIVKIRRSIEDIRTRWNPRLEILGVLPTQVTQRRKLTQEVIEALKGELAGLMFDSVIHDNSAVTESSGHAQSVIDYDRASRGAKDYWSASQELIARGNFL